MDAFDPSSVISNTVVHVMDFSTVAEEELYDIHIPLNFESGLSDVSRCKVDNFDDLGRPCMVHGVACWFDIFFDGSTRGEWLTTAPGCSTTHWFQLRCVLPQPMSAVHGTKMIGSLRLKAHSKQSYVLDLSLEIPPLAQGVPTQKMDFTYDLKEPYYRQLMNYWHTQVPPMQHSTDGAYHERQY